MNRECPERKLDFHAPLLSTRRPSRIIVPREKLDMDSSTGFNDRVPFSWEQSPGKPKAIILDGTRKNKENLSNLAFVMPLKPPPIRLHPQSQHSKDSSSKEHEDGDDGCDGDVDDNYEDIDFFSGGLDLFSLAESSNNGNMATKKDKKVSRKFGGRRRAPPTPSFMMERFLPAAVALAASSSSYPAFEASATASSGVGIRGCESDAGKVVEGGRGALPSVSSPYALKSCGLEMLLPWRATPKKNASKGPLRFGCSDWKPHLSPKPK